MKINYIILFLLIISTTLITLIEIKSSYEQLGIDEELPENRTVSNDSRIIEPPSKLPLSPLLR